MASPIGAGYQRKAESARLAMTLLPPKNTHGTHVRHTSVVCEVRAVVAADYSQTHTNTRPKGVVRVYMAGGVKGVKRGMYIGCGRVPRVSRVCFRYPTVRPGVSPDFGGCVWSCVPRVLVCVLGNKRQTWRECSCTVRTPATAARGCSGTERLPRRRPRPAAGLPLTLARPCPARL